VWRLLIVAFLALTCIASAVAQSNRPSPSPGRGNQQPKSIAQPAQQQPAADQRGTDNAPLIVRVIPTPKTEQESTQDQTQRDDESSANWWMVRLTGVIAIIGLIQAFVFWVQAGRLKATIIKMDEIATGQTNDMQDSIAQAGRAAAAMEHVAHAMAENVENLKITVGINREIADRQKLVTELQSRAYLSVIFNGIVPQDSTTGIRFQPSVMLINNGNTPAYKVIFRTATDVLPHPLPNDFGFPLPDALPHRSISVIGPRLHKIMSAVVPKLYSDVEVEQIKIGIGQRLHMWGHVTYEDAFGIERYVKYSFSFYYLADGKSSMSTDTAHHNDSS
jgi:hypothetical protein